MDYGYDTDYLDPDDLYGDDAYEDDFGYEPDPAYEEKVNSLLGYVQARAEHEQREQAEAQRAADREELQRFAKAHPDIREPEVLNAVADRLNVLADRAGDDSIVSDPAMVAEVYGIVAAERNTPPSPEQRQDDWWASIEATRDGGMPDPDPKRHDERRQRALGRIQERRAAGAYEGERAPFIPDESRADDAEADRMWAGIMRDTGDPIAKPREPSVSEQVAAGVKEAITDLGAEDSGAGDSSRAATPRDAR